MIYLEKAAKGEDVGPRRGETTRGGMFNGAYLSEAAYQGKRLGELLSFPHRFGAWGLGCWEILYQYGFK